MFYTFAVCLMTIVICTDSIAALATSGTTYQPFPPLQNVLYFAAFAFPWSNYFTLPRGRGNTVYNTHWFFFRLVTIISFAICGSMSLYSSIILLSYVANNSTPLFIQLLSPGSWPIITILRASAQLIITAWSIFEVTYSVILVGIEMHSFPLRDTTTKKKDRHDILEDTKKHKNKSPNKKKHIKFWYTWVMFILLVLFASIIGLVIVIFSVTSAGFAIWQQADSPHFLLLSAICMSWRSGTFGSNGIIGFLVFFTFAVCISLAHLFLEIDRINDVTQWMSLIHYEELFNMTTGLSIPIGNLYRFKDFDQTFIDAFGILSTSLHLFHVILVVLGVALFAAEISVTIAVIKRGEKCLFFTE